MNRPATTLNLLPEGTKNYQSTVIKASPDKKKELKEAKELLDRALLSAPKEEDFSEDENGCTLFLDGWDVARERTEKALPEDFPFDAYVPEDIMDIMDKQVFTTYTGPVYWSKQCMVWDSKIDKLKIIKVCLRVYEGGDRPMTVRSFVEGVAALKFNPGEHTFLEKIYLELRKIEGKEVITVVFHCGS